MNSININTQAVHIHVNGNDASAAILMGILSGGNFKVAPAPAVGDVKTDGVTAAPAADSVVGTSASQDLMDKLDVGMAVRWDGQKFHFNGTVKRIDVSNIDDADVTSDTKVIFLTPNAGQGLRKTISLTKADILTGGLTIVQ